MDDSYLALQIAIDNRDSGHAELGLLAVQRYLEELEQMKGRIWCSSLGKESRLE